MADHIGSALLFVRLFFALAFFFAFLLDLFLIVAASRLVHLLGEFSREETEVDAMLHEVLSPRNSLLQGHHIRLVHEEQVALLLVDLLDVLVQIVTPEHERVACIDNLHDQVGSFDDTPQLPPHLQVALEGSHEQVVDFLELSQISPPVKESFLLAGV